MSDILLSPAGRFPCDTWTKKFPIPKGYFCELKLLFLYAYSTPLFGSFRDYISYTPIYERGALETFVNSLSQFVKENTTHATDSSACGAILHSGQANLSRLQWSIVECR